MMMMTMMMRTSGGDSAVSANNDSAGKRGGPGDHEMLISQGTGRPAVERRTRPPQKEGRNKAAVLNCPRCNSGNTKFCYYNNYSLSQPRYFCKTCRRYWTEGGSLRNVPVGGGSRKNNKRSSSSATKQQLPPPSRTELSNNNQADNDQLKLEFAGHRRRIHEQFGGFPNLESSAIIGAGNNGEGGSTGTALELGPANFAQALVLPEYPAVGFGLPTGLKPPTLGFNIIDYDSTGKYSTARATSGLLDQNGGRFFFPFDGLRPMTMDTAAGSGVDQKLQEQSAGIGQDDCTGFWNGMMGPDGAGGAGSW